MTAAASTSSERGLGEVRGSPPRRLRGELVAALVLGLGLVLGACGGAASPGPSFPASPIDGVIIAVDAASLSDVRGFTLLTRAGQRIAFSLGVLEDPTQFPPGHLAEHQATSTPVRVYFRVENGVPVVYRLADAPSNSAVPSAAPSRVAPAAT